MATDTFACWLRRQLRPSWQQETSLRLQCEHHQIREYYILERYENVVRYFPEPGT